MKNHFRHFTLFAFIGLFILPAFQAIAQKVDKNDIEFSYVQLPLYPLDASIKAYNPEIVMAYEADILAAQQQAQEGYERELADYPQRVDAARAAYDEAVARYEEEMKAWEEKSAALRIVEKKILDENTKPVKPGNFYPPSKPVLRELRHQKLFNTDMLANSYLKLEGFEKGTESALMITTTLYGFEATEPELKQEEKSVYNSKTKQTVKVIKYWYEITYRHPINLKVETPSGEVLVDETFAAFSEYALYKSPVKEGAYPAFNRDATMSKLETEVVEYNMKVINEFLNNNYGYPLMTRTTTIYNIEPKKFNYDDYQQAYVSVITGLKLLASDEAASSEKIAESVAAWEKAMEESNPADKKSRVNESVSIATLFNLAEACIMTSDFSKADDYLNQIYGLNPSKKEGKAIDAYKEFLQDMKLRWEANQI
jgi:hypothetical protein